MRNLLAYPLTDQEVLDWISRKEADFLESQQVGGMEGEILDHLKRLVEANPISTTQTSTASK